VSIKRVVVNEIVLFVLTAKVDYRLLVSNAGLECEVLHISVVALLVP
jgi:hypothetical protein